MKKILTFLLTVSIAFSMVTPASASLVPVNNEPNAKTVKAALTEFKNLSKKERKERVKNVKKEWKQFNKENKKSKVEQVVLIILAILLPPLAVYLHQGEINGKFWISLLLWFLFILPGVIYALLVVTDTI